MLKNIFFISINLIFIHSSFPQKTPVVYLAPFKNDAQGAYTLIHDDFGAGYAHGIEEYADTMAFNRGIHFSFALITGQCDKADWEKANELIAHGHQVLNHSMSHICGQHFDWCTFGNWDEKDFPDEIDKSTELIERNTGFHPAFFIFPFDLFTDTMISYLRYNNYVGARAGAQNVTENALVDDPFRLKFNVFHPEHSPADLNGFANLAIQKKSWAIRVIHGVNDESWGKINLKDYADHLNYLKSLSDSNKIWVANLSDVVFYSFLKENHGIEMSVDDKGRVSRIEFIKSSQKLNSSYYNRIVTTTKLRTLTVVIAQSHHKVSRVIQQKKEISFRIEQGKILIDADPSAGLLTLFY